MNINWSGLSSTDWAIIAGLAAAVSTMLAGVITASVAIGGILYQGKLLRRSMAVDLLTRKEEQFNRPEMMRVRQLVAQRFEQARVGGIRFEAIKIEEIADIEFVLDFFETLAFLVQKRVLDAEMVWVYFGTLAIHYYAAGRPYIEQIRNLTGDDTFYQGFDTLVRAQIKINQRNNEKAAKRLLRVPDGLPLVTSKSFEDFLQGESTLLSSATDQTVVQKQTAVISTQSETVASHYLPHGYALALLRITSQARKSSDGN